MLGRARFDVARHELASTLLRAMTLFGGFTLWSFLSITWADAKGEPGTAPTGRCSSSPSTRCSPCSLAASRSALLLGVLATGTAAVGSSVFLAGAGSASAKAGSTRSSRLRDANAALFLAAFWPAAVLASRRETPWPARGLLFAVSGCSFSSVCSHRARGSLPAFALALALYLALMPDRARSLLTLLTIGAATALSAGRLLEVYRADPGEDLQQALASAKTALVLTAVCLAASGRCDRAARAAPRKLPTAAPRLRRLVVASVLVLWAGGRRSRSSPVGLRLASATGSRAAATTCGASPPSSSRTTRSREWAPTTSPSATRANGTAARSRCIRTASS